MSWGVSSIYKDAYSLSPVVEGRSLMNKKRKCPEHTALCEEVSLCPVCLIQKAAMLLLGCVPHLPSLSSGPSVSSFFLLWQHLVVKQKGKKPQKHSSCRSFHSVPQVSSYLLGWVFYAGRGATPRVKQLLSPGQQACCTLWLRLEPVLAGGWGNDWICLDPGNDLFQLHRIAKKH